MIWLALANLNFLINSILWHGRVDNFAPVWCDISTKYVIGVNTAVGACTLCIVRRLYLIATTDTVIITESDKKRAIAVDLAICVGIPILDMILHYIPQGHRFDILEDVGCYPTIYSTWVAIVLVTGWPLALGCISAIYGLLCLRAFHRRRKQINELLSRNTTMNSNHYIRLMCLAASDILFTVPFSTFIIAQDVKIGLSPWISWEDTHFGFSMVLLEPAMFWRADKTNQSRVEFTRWAPVMCSVVFFGLFGLTARARKNYRTAATFALGKMGLSLPVATAKNGEQPQSSVLSWNARPGVSTAFSDDLRQPAGIASEPQERSEV
ncbi:a-factor receptor [Marasmius crinis-equi]|uniref:A-factor receptor n=1 Tax=Marasmius crinis-equi TaxID=585013 RepID=A0ABR3FE58_9AGAR